MIQKYFTIGIDAANLRRGGGVTHLVELLQAVQPEENCVDRVVVWGGKALLDALEDAPWLTKRNPKALNQGLVKRSLWQRYYLAKAAKEERCDVLFVPGGSYAGNFYPVVTMSQNLLPFEISELRRYGLSLLTLKLLLLRQTQSRSFKKSNGIIFLTEYARTKVLDTTGQLESDSCIVPHGVNPRFKRMPKNQKQITQYKSEHPFRILYVSIIDQYKHQWNVVEAVNNLRKEGYPIALDLVGPAYGPSLRRLTKTMSSLNADSSWVNYHGAIPFDELNIYYAKADLGLFASSCENMPNILLETMASGLPIACSGRGPMPELLGESGIYFDPEKSASIADAVRELIEMPKLRAELAAASYLEAEKYSWRRCAYETFRFIIKIARKNLRY